MRNLLMEFWPTTLGLSLALIVIITASLGGCSDKRHARQLLIENGYKPIEVGGFDWLDGNKNYNYKTKFKAVSPTGDTICGTVSKAWWNEKGIITIK
jgi:hypothetical protein